MIDEELHTTNVKLQNTARDAWLKVRELRVENFELKRRIHAAISSEMDEHELEVEILAALRDTPGESKSKVFASGAEE